MLASTGPVDFPALSPGCRCGLLLLGKLGLLDAPNVIDENSEEEGSDVVGALLGQTVGHHDASVDPLRCHTWLLQGLPQGGDSDTNTLVRRASRVLDEDVV